MCSAEREILPFLGEVLVLPPKKARKGGSWRGPAFSLAFSSVGGRLPDTLHGFSKYLFIKIHKILSKAHHFRFFVLSNVF